MRFPERLLVIAAAALLGACEMEIGNEANDAGNGGGDVAAAGNVSASGKSEEGQLSISAPGFKMKLDIPEAIRTNARIDNDSGLIYPNARFSGIHVEGGRERTDGGNEGEVELRFASSDSPETIARWYRDPARSSDFTIASSSQEGDSLVVAGTTADDGGQFRIRLSPAAGGGSDGRVLLSETR